MSVLRRRLRVSGRIAAPVGLSSFWVRVKGSSNYSVQCLGLSLFWDWSLPSCSASMIQVPVLVHFSLILFWPPFPLAVDFSPFLPFFCICDFALWPLSLAGFLSSARCPLCCVALSISLAQLSLLTSVRLRHISSSIT